MKIERLAKCRLFLRAPPQSLLAPQGLSITLKVDAHGRELAGKRLPLLKRLRLGVRAPIASFARDLCTLIRYATNQLLLFRRGEEHHPERRALGSLWTMAG